jgi:serine/threonine protein kinase
MIMDVGLSEIVSRSEFTVAGTYGPCRWQAPEVLDPSDEVLDSDVSPYTTMSDVYSLGMTILEVLSDRIPFSQRRYDTVVILEVLRGVRPRRPADVSNNVWSLLQSCWSAEPSERPSASMVGAWLSTIRCFELTCT